MIRSSQHHPLVSLAATALLALVCALTMVCTNAHAANEDGSPTATATAEDELPPPLQRLREARLAELRAELSALDVGGGEKVTKDRAVMLYHIAELSNDFTAAGDVVDLFETLIARDPGDAQLRVYLGAAYTLRARDFPLQGVFMVLPGPGYVRLYHLGKGVQILNDALAANGNDPMARLIRGVTFSDMPRLFGRHEEGLADLELLREWVDNPKANPQYEALLTDRAFRGDALVRLAVALWAGQQMERSREMFLRTAAQAPAASPTALAAKEMAERLAR